MIFIEVHVNENNGALEKLIQEAFTGRYSQALPSVGFGRVIVWNGRMFQELQLPNDPDAPLSSYENSILYCWNLPDDRARMQVGSIRGALFTTPPETGGELAARIKEGGRCGAEYVVRPFQADEFHQEI